MNEEKGAFRQMSNFAKKGVKLKLMMYLVPIILLLFIIMYAALDVEIDMEAVICQSVENCDSSVSTQKVSVLHKKDEMQKKYQGNLVSAKKKQVGRVQLAASVYQKPTNQPITDKEFVDLADRMKEARNELVNLDLSEDAENYGTVGLESGGSIGDIDVTGMEYWEMALEASKHTGWHPLFIMSQWQLETGHFKSNNLKQNNNIAGQTWTESSKYPKGTARPANEGGWYIKYPDPVTGYVDFILTNTRYNKVKTFNTPEEQAKEVAKQGWAADPLYADKLISMIAKNRKIYGDVGIQTKDSNTGTDGGGVKSDTLDLTEGDKVVAEAYRMLETRGIKSSNPIKYSMPLRGQDAYGDCSEFTMMVYKKALGVNIGSTTIEQIAKNAKYFNTDVTQLQPGDLVYFNTPGGHAHSRIINGKRVEVDHTGIYVGDNKFIDLSYGVGYISLKDIGPGGKFEKYFKQSFIGFIRLGEPGTGNGVMTSLGSYDEAEIHIRALANSDWYAIDETNLFKTKNGDPIYEKYKDKQIPILKDEYKDTNVQDAYYVAIELEGKKESSLLFNYVGKARAKDWGYQDWILNTQLIAYNCYLLGNDTDMDKDGMSGFKEWISNLFSNGPCEELDEKLYVALKERGKLNGRSEDDIQFIEINDRGVLKQYYEKREYSYECNPPPPPPPPEEEKDTGGGQVPPPKKDNNDDDSRTPVLERVRGKNVGTARLVDAIKRKDLSIEVGKGKHDCTYDVKKEHVDITQYPVYPSLYSGAKDTSVLKTFEKYSMVIPGVNTGSDEDFEEEVGRILRLFYGNELEKNEAMLQTVGGGNDFIVPMEDGTYNFSSAFRTQHRPTHQGVDMGTLGVSGVPIYATSNGEVVSTGWVDGYGYSVMIKHDNGLYSFYAHMLEDYIVVKKGQKVTQAQLIGGVDGVPNLEQHLHFEVCQRSIETQSGNLMCQDWVDPQEDDNSKDGKEDDAKLKLNPNQDMKKSNKMATQFLKEWKENAKKGKLYYMPGYSSGVSGVLSEANENKKGDCVNTPGDLGGMSCGFYQLANNYGKVCGLVNWFGSNGYSDYYNYFKSYCPNNTTKVSQVSAFMSRWAGLENSSGQYPADFKNAQRLYVKSSMYDPVAKTVLKELGLDLNTRHIAVQEMIWSAAVHHPAYVDDLFRDAGYSKSTDWSKVTDEELITNYYDARYDTVTKYFSSSPQFWKGLRDRFVREKGQALKILQSGS